MLIKIPEKFGSNKQRDRCTKMSIKAYLLS